MKFSEEDMYIFLMVIASRQWRNGHLVELADTMLNTGKLDRSLIEPKFLKKLDED